MKIVWNLDSEDEANGVLFALGKLPLEQVGVLYTKLQQQTLAQVNGRPVLGAPIPPPAPGRRPPKRAPRK